MYFSYACGLSPMEFRAHHFNFQFNLLLNSEKTIAVVEVKLLQNQWNSKDSIYAIQQNEISKYICKANMSLSNSSIYSKISI